MRLSKKYLPSETSPRLGLSVPRREMGKCTLELAPAAQGCEEQTNSPTASVGLHPT